MSVMRRFVAVIFAGLLAWAPTAHAILKAAGSPSAVMLSDGLVTAPSLGFGSLGSGFYVADSVWNFSASSTYVFDFNAAGIALKPLGIVGWRAAGSGAGTLDTAIGRASANSLVFGTGLPTTTTTSRTEMNKAVATIANAVATTVLTITIPNAAHSASLRVRVTCSLGAGGAIGANEATATNEYIVSVARTTGVNAAAAISAAYGAAATAVAGAATVTATAALGAVVGAVGASNTIPVQATVSRSGGSSDNHTCLVYGQLMNANATGVTIS